MGTYLLCHRHEAAQCRFAFAAWRGFGSPLRRTSTLSSCPQGRHEIWWTVDAADRAAALAQLPPFLRTRTEAIPVCEVPIP
ncbi:MAG: hypothetical protein L0H84_12140 [Pseudonocardia sp.]|nr:hypothetical protein [Pseudonocardia sp.]